MAIVDHHSPPATFSACAVSGAPSNAADGLRPVIGIKDLVLMVVGTVIGSGIFLVPSVVLQAVGNSVPMALLVWLAGGILSLLGALTYGELSALKPRTGGLYVYIRDCFGPLPAFLFGWTMFLVISSGSIAALAVAFSNYLGELLPLSWVGVKAIAVLMIVVITALNIRGTRQSADVLNVTTAGKVLAIVALSSLLVWKGSHPIFAAASPADHHAPAFGFALAMVSVLWAYEGWQYATYIAGETIDPQRAFPLGLFAGTLALVGLYVFANFAYVAALGACGVAHSTRVAASALHVVVSHGAARIVAAAILISIFSAANSVMLNSPRIYYAMAKDGLFFDSLSRVHPRFGTPARAIAVAGVWSALLALSGTFEQLLTYVVFIGWIFYALAAASVFVYRKRLPDATRAYRVPAYPFTPILFIAAASAVVIGTVLTQPLRAAIGLGIMSLGVLAYVFWRRGASMDPGTTP